MIERVDVDAVSFGRNDDTVASDCAVVLGASPEYATGAYAETVILRDSV